MVITLTGSNVFLRSKKLAELKADFSKKFGAENIEKISAETLEVQDLPSLVQGGSLFSSSRMVVVYDLSQNKVVADTFLSYLEKVPEDIQVVLIESQLDKRTALYKSLKKSSDFHEFEEPKEYELTKWISDYTHDFGGSIDSGSSKLLIEYVGVNQQRLAGEIEKLVTYEPKVTSNNVKLLVERRPQSTVFQLLEYTISGQKQKAQNILGELEKAFEDPFQIASLLIWQVQILTVVKSAGSRSDSEIAKSAKINPYVISKTKNLTRSVDSKQLLNIVNLCSDLDLSLKSTNASPWQLLEHTILSF